MTAPRMNKGMAIAKAFKSNAVGATLVSGDWLPKETLADNNTEPVADGWELVSWAEFEEAPAEAVEAALLTEPEEGLATTEDEGAPEDVPDAEVVPDPPVIEKALLYENKL